ncbi:hypothetical protein SDRG_15307 [Saprolegnia diclina VS20]|uniref:Phytanoyl-CoA dioxygenase n=1 Tax=Saprolegnia diclina (strain VS20) TaxID=1156394 RepID=T0PN90_SAPDV|nr:hypothetical protein SDRG_15307 [Saprolegnia diclina VS20]EQC26884.1 hypothetical protein SDRG_15307 [Saprolegnia diclina VS20]|eukprot:XP_008619697.1 hypothetical protein SDRG_15307 [Saprolegnia diclina VS20]
MFCLLDPQATAAVSIDYSEIAADPSRFLAIMAEQGFAVVTNVVDDVAYAEGLWASDLRAILDMTHSAETRALAEDPVHTWPADVQLGRPVEHGLAQGQLAWHIRRSRKIRHCYEILHGTKELVVGTDSIMFNRSPPKKLRQPWGHVDYHRDLIAHECFQSIVYLWDTNDESSTTVVWPGSHRTQYEAVMDGNPVPRLFSLIPEAMVDEYRASAFRVRVPKGAMIVWNSKLVHQGYDWGPRLAVPVCFEPAALRPDNVWAKKCALVASGVSGTHWAAVFHTHSATRKRKNAPRGPSQEFGRVRLLHRAHLHLLDDNGQLKPEFAALL